MPELPSPPLELRMSADGAIAFSFGDQEICYRGRSSCEYGRLATKAKEPFCAVILHHNPPHRSLDWLIDYQLKGDETRGGHFGYHFYVVDDGRVHQGAPLTVRTNHIKGLGYKVRKDFGKIAENRNSIGVTCVGAERPEGFVPTRLQKAATISLVRSLSHTFDIPIENVFGHGEIQSDRRYQEGASIAAYIRSVYGERVVE